jgi:hypothetical protein
VCGDTQTQRLVHSQTREIELTMLLFTGRARTRIPQIFRPKSKRILIHKNNLSPRIVNLNIWLLEEMKRRMSILGCFGCYHALFFERQTEDVENVYIFVIEIGLFLSNLFFLYIFVIEIGVFLLLR